MADSEVLRVRLKNSNEWRTLSPGDVLYFSLDGFKSKSEWSISYPELKKYAGTSGGLLEVRIYKKLEGE